MTVDKFPHTERGIRRTSCPLVPCGDGSFDVTGERLTAEKVPYFWAFRASDRQRRGAKMAAKTLMWEHIKGNVRRVE